MDEEILKDLNIDYEIELVKEDDMEIIVNHYFETLAKVVKFIPEGKKEILIEMVCSNMEYTKNGDKRVAYFDIYDWNMVTLYYKFAEYVILGKEPDFSKTDSYFKKVNIEEYNDFKEGKHKYLQIPKPTLDSLLELIKKNGLKSLTSKQNDYLKEYSNEEKLKK